MPEFLKLFQKAVLDKMPMKPVAPLAIPQLTQDQLADPIHKANEYRIPLLNQVSVFASSAKATRLHTVTAAMNYLKTNQAQLLGVAQNDLAALDEWRLLVEQGQVEFAERYRREFLATERFPRFDEALVRLLDLLEIPGIGKVVGSILRAPGDLIKFLVTKMAQRPVANPLPERPVLEGSLNGWLDGLRKEAARRAKTHPVWAHIDRSFTCRQGRSISRPVRAELEKLSPGHQSGGGSNRPQYLRDAGEESGRPEHAAGRQADV